MLRTADSSVSNVDQWEVPLRDGEIAAEAFAGLPEAFDAPAKAVDAPAQAFDAPAKAFPSPATHWASVQLKAGETACKTPFGSKTI